MSINLLEMMSSSIGQQLIGQAGKFLGESDGAMNLIHRHGGGFREYVMLQPN